MSDIVKVWRADLATESDRIAQERAEARAAVAEADAELIPIEAGWLALNQTLDRYRASEKAKFRGYHGFIADRIEEQRKAYLTAKGRCQIARDLVKLLEERLAARREAVAELDGILLAELAIDPPAAPVVDATASETQAEQEVSAVEKFRREYPAKQRSAA